MCLSKCLSQNIDNAGRISTNSPVMKKQKQRIIPGIKCGFSYSGKCAFVNFECRCLSRLCQLQKPKCLPQFTFLHHVASHTVFISVFQSGQTKVFIILLIIVVCKSYSIDPINIFQVKCVLDSHTEQKIHAYFASRIRSVCVTRFFISSFKT